MREPRNGRIVSSYVMSENHFYSEAGVSLSWGRGVIWFQSMAGSRNEDTSDLKDS